MLNRYSIWATLVAQHIWRWYLVSCQVLASISLVIHFAALTILSCNSFTFFTFHSKHMSFTKPQNKKYRGVKSGEQEAQEMGSPLPIQWSGNSLSRKAWTWWEKWGDEPSNCETVPTGTRHKAVFSIKVRKVLTSHCMLFKKERADKLVFHQITPHIDLYWIILLFSNVIRIFLPITWQLCLFDCSTHINVASSEKHGLLGYVLFSSMCETVSKANCLN
jgi:hypothetical protein